MAVARGEFADKFNNMPKYVVSTTPRTLEDQHDVISGDVAEVAHQDEVDGDIVVTARAWRRGWRMIVDELRLMVFLVVPGKSGCSG